jgi:hypothetical protein
VTRKPRLSKLQLSKLGRLLWMQYKPSEVAAEIGVSAHTITHVYIPAGCPHTKDESGRIWIVGTEFAAWAVQTSDRHHPGMDADQAYCLHCKRAVKMIDPTVRWANRYIQLMAGTCAECGGKVNRASKHQQD